MVAGQPGLCPHCRTEIEIPDMDQRTDADTPPSSDSNPTFTRDNATMDKMSGIYKGAGFPNIWYIGHLCYVESANGNPMDNELAQLQELLIDLVENQKHPRLIVGFNEAVSVGSAMMGLLIKMYKIISASEGQFGVIVRNKNTLKAFKIVKLDSMIPIFSNLRNLLEKKRFGADAEVPLVLSARAVRLGRGTG